MNVTHFAVGRGENIWKYLNINFKIEGDIETRVKKKKETNLNSIYYQRWAIFSQEDITFCLCVCVFRTRRQRAASVRPGCDRCVEVGGVGAETGTADTGQPQQGEASRLRHRLPLASRFHLDWKIICASPTFVCCHYFLRLLSRLQSCLLLFDV